MKLDRPIEGTTVQKPIVFEPNPFSRFATRGRYPKTCVTRYSKNRWADLDEIWHMHIGDHWAEAYSFWTRCD